MSLMQSTVKSTTQFSEKLIAFTVLAAVHFGIWAPFLGYQCTVEPRSTDTRL